jgi:hypothetical protein
MLKSALWKLLLLVSPDRYEKRKARRFGHTYPDVFDTTRSIFIHIPKAAGTSVAMALYGRNFAHTTWRDWRELNPKKFNAYFKFAIMRDPVARFVSAFHYLRNGGMNAQDKDFGERVLKNFRDANELAKALVEPVLQRSILGWCHFRPQADYVADEHGQPQMDLILRFENLDEGFDRVAHRLCGEVRKLPHLNTTRDRPEPVLDKDARDVLECIYRRDFVLWQKHAA